MSSDLLINLNKLIEFKTISDNFNSIQHKFNKSVGNGLNIELNDNFVIDLIKDCKSDIKIIEFKQNSNKLKCFWPKCHFITNNSNKLENHQIIHKNIKSFKCEKCYKTFGKMSNLINHRFIHKNIKT